MKKIQGGVTAAKGFEAAGVAAEIKYKGRTDMAIVYSQMPCKAAGTFTTNVASSHSLVSRIACISFASPTGCHIIISVLEVP